MSEPAYGQRFLDQLKALGVSLSPLNFEQLQELKSADREAVIRILAKSGASLTYAATRAIRVLEPEELAKQVAIHGSSLLTALAAVAVPPGVSEASDESLPSGASEERSYGGRFLAAIQKGRIPLSFLNFESIQELKTADREGTIELLRSPDGTLSYAGIRGVRELEPEELARRVIASYAVRPSFHSALSAISVKPPALEATGDVEQPYGLRFMNALREMGGGYSWSNYKTTQRVKAADREEMIRILRAEGLQFTYAGVQAIRAMEPDELAQRVMSQAQAAQQQMAIGMLIMIAVC